jgi:PKD repeat protein
VSFIATGNNICNPPAPVSFTNSSSGFSPLFHNWSFGDGFFASSVHAVHSYSTVGSYSVRLRVTDGHGCIDSSLITDYVTVSGLTAGYTPPSPGCQGSPVTFTNTSAMHLFSTWDFGDGFTSADENGVHAYALPGVFNTRLVVSDGICYDTTISPVTINAIPSGTFTITPTVPCPAPVTVNYAATIPPGCTTLWQFMGTGTGTGVTTSKSYAFGRIDTVKLTVTNSNGCVRLIEKVDTIFNLSVTVGASQNLGCIPLTTTFTNTVSATAFIPASSETVFLPVPYTITGYSWNFGDGSPAVTGPSPAHTFSTVGTFNVNCTITTSNGCTKTGTIQVRTGVPPTVVFTAVPTHICAGQNVVFTSTVTGTANTYKWLYGNTDFDTGNASFANRVHKFKVPGIDTVKLRAYHNGCPSPEVRTVIYIDSPNAVPVFNYLCTPNNGIAFGDSSLGADTRLWIFGDGNTSPIKNPVHFYPSLSTFNATLTTFNAGSGCRDTVAIEVDLDPPSVFLSTPDPTICAGQVITLNAGILGADALRYKWYDNGALFADTTLDEISASFGPGYHDITLIIKNDRGCFDTLTRNDYLLVGNPTAAFSAVPASGCGPLPVNFNDLSTGIPECRLKFYDWTFGDGVTLSATTPGTAHTYTLAGTYNAVLTVTDSIGCTDASPVVPIAVYRPTASFYASINNVCVGSAVHFNNVSSAATSYLWMFGDGNTSTLTAPDHVYATGGVYTVRLVAIESHGCTDTATLLNYIFVAPSPVAAFTMSDTFAVCPPLNVIFTNASIGAASYNWSFGNSSSSVATNPSSPYTAAGYYTIRLVAYNSIGCTDTAYGNVNIFGYTGAFSYTPMSGCTPLPVHFSTSLGSVASLIWDFGDGFISGLSTADTISHTYLIPGQYIPKLILTDSTGCTNSSISPDTIKVDVLNAKFRINPNPVCQGSSVTFTDSSYATYSAPSVWAWSFGSSASGTGYSVAHTFTLPGTHVVTLTVSNPIGCTSSTVRTVTVNPLPDTIAGLRTVCVGFTTTLTNATGTGAWSSSAPATASVSTGGVVSGLIAGTARISYTTAAGCFVTAVVTVNAPPGAVTGTNNICAGTTSAFASTPPGGAWSSSHPLIATVNAVTGLVGGIAPGTATISYSSGVGCTATRPLTVNAIPAPISGIPSVCLNATTTLTQSVIGGVWSSGVPAVATVSATGVVTGIVAGTAGITYTMPGSCFAAVVVTVNPLPSAISGPSAYCTGAGATFTSSPSTGSWSSSNPGISSIVPLTGAATGVAAGTANIIYTLTTGCVATKPVTVNQSPAPITGTLSLCENTTTSLTQTVAGGAWSSGTPAVATVSASGVVTGIVAGTAGITYTMPGSCTISVVVTVNAPPSPIVGPSNYCTGTGVAFTSSPGPGTWSSSNPAVSSILATFGATTGLTAGTTTISYTLTTGCFATKTVTVNLAPDPIGGSASLCQNTTTTLTQSVVGGTWSSSTPAVATVSTTGIVTGISAGTSAISYSMPGLCVTTVIVTVYALPATISGVSSICAGSSATLTTSSGSGAWSSSQPLVASVTASGGLVTGVSAGTATITYSLGTGCITTRDITVNTAPGAITGNQSLCNTYASPLSVSPAGGAWSSSAPAVATVSSAGVVSPLSVGTSGITYALANGCLSSVVVTVNALPDTIAGNPSLCYGAATALTNATPSGTWSSSNASVAIIHPVSGLVLGMSVGTAVISYTVSSGCYTTKTVSVNMLPAPITGISVFCQGTTITLNQSVPGGTWTSGNITAATVNASSGAVTGMAGGTAVITYSLPTGCFATKAITVNPLPDTIAGNPGLCLGISSLLTNATPGGIWSSSDPFVAPIGSTGIIHGVALGTATIYYSLTTGCTRSITVTVNPLPAPITGVTVACVGAIIHLSDVTPGGTWMSGNPAVATIDAATGDYMGISGGNVTITYTAPTGCIATIALTIEAIPPPIVGGPTVCAGFAVNLTNTLPGGMWSSDPAAAGVGTINPITGVVTAITPGTISVSYTVMTGCMRDLIVTVLPLPSVISGSPNVCESQTSLLGNAVPGGTWSSASPSIATVNAATGLVTGIAAGSTVISYMLGTGCFNVLHIDVHPLPAPITGPDSVCEGSVILQTDATPGGIWMSGAVGTAAIGSLTGILTGISAGTAFISYALPTNCYVTRVVTVNTTPPAIIGNPHICTGSTVTMTNALPGGVWSSSNNLIASISAVTGVVTPISLGTAVISYVLSSTGCYATKTVTVEPLPLVFNVTGGGNYCAGGSGVSIGVDSSQPGVSYVLYYGASVSGYVPGTGYPISFGPLTPGGTYTVLATNATSGCTRVMSGAAVVTVVPLVTPSVGIATSPNDTVCPGTTVTLLPLPVYGGLAPGYLWKVNGVVVDSAASYSFIPANGDVVTVRMASDTSCVTLPYVTGTKVLTVLPVATPAVTLALDPGDTVCKHTVVNFTAIPAAGGYTPAFYWSVNGLFATTGSGYAYEPADGDIVRCTMVSNYLCRTADTAFGDGVTIRVAPYSEPHVVIASTPGLSVTAGTPVTLQAYPSGAGPSPSFQWRVNGYPVPGATSDIYTSIFNDYDSVVCVVGSSGVCDDIFVYDWVYISVNPLGFTTNSVLPADIRLTPNPNTGSFNIAGTLGNATVNEPVAITVTDMLGQVIYTGNVSARSGEIDARVTIGSDLSNGMYMLNLDWGSDRKVFHFVLRR